MIEMKNMIKVRQIREALTSDLIQLKKNQVNYMYYPELINMNSETIQSWCDIVERSNWLIYMFDEKELPNPLAIAQLANEIGIEFDIKSLPDYILEVIKEFKFTAYSEIIWGIQFEYPQVNSESMHEVIVKDHPEIRQLPDWSYILSTEVFPDVVDHCLSNFHRFPEIFKHYFRSFS